MKRNFLLLQLSHLISTCRSPHMDPRIDLHMDHHMDPQMDPYMDPLMDPHMDPYMDPHGYSYGSSYECSTMNNSVENSNHGCCLKCSLLVYCQSKSVECLSFCYNGPVVLTKCKSNEPRTTERILRICSVLLLIEISPLPK